MAAATTLIVRTTCISISIRTEARLLWHSGLHDPAEAAGICGPNTARANSPLAPKLVVEVQYDHFSGGRFRHGTKLLRWRPDETPVQRSMSQVECESRSPPGYLQLEFSGLRE